MKSLTARFLSLALLLSCMSRLCTSQAPFSTLGGGPFDVINLANLKMHFDVPVIHKRGRGTPFTYDIRYESSVWSPAGVSGNQTWQPAYNWGWRGSTEVAVGYISYTSSSGRCAGTTISEGLFFYIWANFAYHDPYGASHKFAGTANDYTECPTPHSQNLNSSATDGSGYSLVFNGFGSGSKLTSREGLVINAPYNTATGSGQSTDTNGNQISISPTGVFTDTLGTTVLTVAGTGTPTSPETFTYTGPSGNVPYTIHFTNKTVKTNFGCSGISEYGPTTVPLVTDIQLPDNTKYLFDYEATPGFSGDVTGRIKSVTLPTGGVISYAYTDGNQGINCTDGTAATLTRTLNSGSWIYKHTGSGSAWTTTVTDPQSNDTVLNFQKDSSTAPTNSGNFFETQRTLYQGSQTTGTLLLTAVVCWNGNTASCLTAAVSTPITQRSVTLQYPNNGLQSKTTTLYNTFGLVTETDQYAYASGPPTALLQKTQIVYASLGNGIVDRPASITVTDGGGNVLSKVMYGYDESALRTPLVTSPQHIGVTGSRGNVTTIQTLTSWNPSTQSGPSLIKTIAYFDTGNVFQVQDVNSQVTTYIYDTAAQGNTTKSCGNSFPTSYTLPISGLANSVSTTYDCTGGVVTAVTDLNGNTTQTNYNDPYFWRPASLVAPYTSNTSTTTTSLTYTPTTLDSRMVFNGTASVAEAFTTLGSYGQPLYSQQREGPSSANWDSTQLIYDSFLRPYQSTMPCVTTSGTGCASAAKTTTTFDALGRATQITDGGNPTPGWVKYTYTQNDVLQEVGPQVSGENTKQKQSEYDAIGRLVSVCEKTNLTGYGVCSQNTSSPNGYLTTYAYGVTTINSMLYTTVTIVQNAQATAGSRQTRVYTYDLAGRLASEQNPENGTTTYTYYTDVSCTGTYIGDLIKVADAKGNITCYQYDAIHRTTQVTYPSGPDSANTPSKTFVYDSATFNGSAMANPKGRMVEAYTGASGSKTTDEFFSYSVRGEVTDTWQCTPHSGTNGCASASNYYHVTAGFWENGALKALSSSISGLPTETYGVDNMGRTNAVSASSGQSPVPPNGVTYDLANFKTTVNFGSGDSDVFYLDQYTGRQTKYVFSVNGATNTGQTTWNPNGSLQRLQITDNIPGTSDTQTCDFTHDDLARISSGNCMNGATNKWNQQFTYDAFGNISKSTSGTGVNFLPTYDPTKNWITALPGVTPTTDANGQMTYDGIRNYSWDSEHKMHSADANPSDCSISGQCLTYDALGRMVEKRSGSTYTQIVYGPQGRFAIMNAQTLVKAYIPLPGAQAVYTSAGLAYYRHFDHLGSSRLATTPSRTLYSSTAYAPYGEPYSQTGPNTDLSFTRQEQDTVSGIYDFLARKYPVVQGRWLSPDPAGLAAADLSSPQTLNRYAYVGNNPLSNADPTGLKRDRDDRPSPSWFMGLTSLFAGDGVFSDPTGGDDGYCDVLHCVPSLGGASGTGGGAGRGGCGGADVWFGTSCSVLCAPGWSIYPSACFDSGGGAGEAGTGAGSSTGGGKRPIGQVLVNLLNPACGNMYGGTQNGINTLEMTQYINFDEIPPVGPDAQARLAFTTNPLAVAFTVSYYTVPASNPTMGPPATTVFSVVTYLRSSFYQMPVQTQVTVLEHELLHGVGYGASIDQNYGQNYQQIEQNCTPAKAPAP